MREQATEQLLVSSAERPPLLQAICVPHPKKRHDYNVPFSLYDELQIEEAQHRLVELEQAGDLEAFDAERVNIAVDVAQQTFRSLWFPKETNGRDPSDKRLAPDLQTIEKDQIANCYGFTWLASHALDEIGVRHFVGWANGHSFILVPTTRNRVPQVWFVDPLSPYLSRSLEAMTPRPDIESIPTQLEEHGRAVLRLRTDRFDDPRNKNVTFDRLSKEHPWMELSSRRYANEWFSKEARNRVFVSVYESEQGRSVLEHHNAMQRALATGKTLVAAEHVIALAGKYPEVDARDKSEYTKVRALVCLLSRSGEYAIAASVIEAYFSSFTLSDDTRIALRQSECWEIMHVEARQAIGPIAVKHEVDPPVAEEMTAEAVCFRALQAVRHSLLEARRRYDNADHRLRPQYALEVIAGRLASITD